MWCPHGSTGLSINAPKQEPALELHSRATPSVEEHHRVNCPDTGRNSGVRQKKNYPDIRRGV